MKQVLAYKCSHCGKVYENKNSCKAHEYKCYFNPRTKSCASCAFNTLNCGRITKNGAYFETPSCLVNIDVTKAGLQTQCSKYLDRKYSDDKEIMNLVQAKYDPQITLNSFVEKHPDLFV